MADKIEIVATGDTYPQTALLKRLGFRWDAKHRQWWHKVPDDMLVFYERRLRFKGMGVERRKR